MTGPTKTARDRPRVISSLLARPRARFDPRAKRGSHVVSSFAPVRAGYRHAALALGVWFAGCDGGASVLDVDARAPSGEASAYDAAAPKEDEGGTYPRDAAPSTGDAGSVMMRVDAGRDGSPDQPIEASVDAAAMGADDAGPDRTEAGFRHPGLLITREDIARMKAKLASKTEPHTSSYAMLLADPESKETKTIGTPPVIIGRNSSSAYASTRYAAETAAVTAYQNAWVYALTGVEAHAKKTVEILNLYARTTEHFDKADPERDLEAAILGWLWVSAAELVRSPGYSGWAEADLRRFDDWIRHVVYADTDYAPAGVLVTPKANGAGARGAFGLRTKLAIGVYLDDRAIYDEAIAYFFHGKGNGAPSYYLEPKTGQTWEAGRDQGHAQGGLSKLIETAQIAFNQGDASLYGWQDSALRRAVEYIASYNLGNEVSYTPMQPYTTDWADVYEVISSTGRGQLATIYELPYAYFQSTLGMDMPFARQVIEREGAEVFSAQNDNPMFATLAYRR